MMERRQYIDRLRVLSAFAVVAIHVLSHYLGSFPVHSGRWMVTMFLKHLCHFCIPVFFMISGALLIRPLGSMTYSQYLRKRFARICIPFVIWSFIHWLVILVIVKKGSFSLLSFTKLLLSNGISSQYWYVYATLILYLLLPFAGELVSHLDRKQLNILLAVMVFINLILPCLNDVLKTTCGWKITNYNMASMGAYLTFALIGYALSQELPGKKWRIMIYCSGIIAYILINITCWNLSVKSYTNTFGETNYPLACLMGIALFVAVHARSEKRIANKTSRFVQVLSAESYTAYLTHMMCLRLLQLIWPAKRVAAMSSIAGAAAMSVEFILGLIGCFGIAWIAHKLPKVSKYL